jgi:uncharacterized protein DUF4166/saccharopine dehydrogenase-like protein
MKLLILGGYGVFGSRLVELLSDMSGLEILVAGRNLKKATAFCDRIQGAANLAPVKLARDDISIGLAKHRPDILIDASGPFQSYGDNPYTVIQKCIESGTNYLDFADAAEFVFGVDKFDPLAKAAGVFVLSGVSSFPVLTAAVLREMSREMTIKSVIGGIAPSPFAGIGLNVMRAVIGYAGGPIKLRRGGQTIVTHGLTESLRYTIAPPGRLPLENLRFSLVDVPDLQVIPPLHPEMDDIWIGAGPVPESLHRILNLLAKARARLNLPSLAAFSRLFYWVLNQMKFGEHRGGMFIEAIGSENGKQIKKSWHLLAEGDDGPYIPSMAIEALIRNIRTGKSPKAGARAAIADLELADYNTLFANRSIFTGLRQDTSPDAPLYRKILGEAFDQLPPRLRALHDFQGQQVWPGKSIVTRGKGTIAHLLAKVFGFPSSAAGTDVEVTLTSGKTEETWQRKFGDKTFSSRQSEGKGRNTSLLVEKFGPVSVSLALVVQDDRLNLVPRRWSFWGIPLPKFLLPTGKSFEAEKEGLFHFNVTIQAPLVGLIVAYQGWLKPSAPK